MPAYTSNETRGGRTADEICVDQASAAALPQAIRDLAVFELGDCLGRASRRDHPDKVDLIRFLPPPKRREVMSHLPFPKCKPPGLQGLSRPCSGHYIL
jgi:hypothetical protein